MKKNHLIIILSVICFLLFFIGGPGYHASRSFKHFWDTGHILFFVLFTYLMYHYVKTFRNQSFKKQVIIILMITLTIGGGIEIIQAGFSRSSYIGDLYRDFLGAFLALFFILPDRKEIRGWLLKNFRILTITLILISFIPLTEALTDEWNAHRDFPLLSGFESQRELKRWEGNADKSLSSDFVYQGNYSLKADLKTTTYSGVSLKYFPRDFSDYRFIEFRIYNPDSSPLRMTCRIHDKKHAQQKQQLYRDRFNQSFNLLKGWNHIRFDLEDVKQRPEGREMDMSLIYGIGIFTVELPHERSVYVDEVNLVK